MARRGPSVPSMKFTPVAGSPSVYMLAHELEPLCTGLVSLKKEQRPFCVCSKRMVVRKGVAAFFWCVGFPGCRATKPIDQARFYAYCKAKKISLRGRVR